VQAAACSADEGIHMFGIEDKAVGLAYLLCVFGAILCVVYGLFTWNLGDETVTTKDVQWAVEEDKAEQEL